MTVRRFCAFVCLVSLLALTADPPVAQEGPADAPDEPKDVGLVEETGTRLAQLDVTMTGPPDAIAGLTRQDLELVINGKIVEEFTVDRICRDPGDGAAVAEAPPPPETPAADSPVRTTVLAPEAMPVTYLFYFDQPFLTAAGRNKAFDIARDLVDGLITGGSRATIVSSGTAVTTYADMSSDPDELLHAIDKITKDPQQWDPMAITEESRIDEVLDELTARGKDQAAAMARRYQADERWRTDKALRRFSMVLGRMADFDPPKVTIYFADRMRQYPGEYFLSYFSLVQRTTTPALGTIDTDADFAAHAFDKVVKEANAHGTRVYTIEAEGLVGISTTGRRGAAGSRHITAAQDSLVGLAAETGGRAFLNGIRAPKIAGQIRDDLSCLYLISFDPGGFPENSSLPVRLRVFKEKVTAHLRGQIVFLGDSARLTSRLMAAFTAPEALRSDHPISTTIIPTGFDGKQFSALVQISVAGLPLNESDWDIGVSVLSKGKVLSDASGQIVVRGPGTPVVFEAEATFKPGPYEIMAVAHEKRSDEIATGKVTGDWPDINEQVVSLGPIAVIQPAVAAFMRAGEVRTKGSLGRGQRDLLRTDLPTALITLVCRDKASKGLFVVERTLMGASSADFEPLELDLKTERCAQVRDLLKPGTMTEGSFTYELRVQQKGLEVATAVRLFSAVDEREEGGRPAADG